MPTKALFVIFEPGDVVVVPFPFTDRQTTKRRPALVLSNATQFDVGHCVLAMITSHGNATWLLDTTIQNGASAGLKAASIVRMKLFTLDNRLILQKIGHLETTDAQAVSTNLKALLSNMLQ